MRLGSFGIPRDVCILHSNLKDQSTATTHCQFHVLFPTPIAYTLTLEDRLAHACPVVLCWWAWKLSASELVTSNQSIECRTIHGSFLLANAKPTVHKKIIDWPYSWDFAHGFAMLIGIYRRRLSVGTCTYTELWHSVSPISRSQWHWEDTLSASCGRRGNERGSSRIGDDRWNDKIFLVSEG